MWAIEISLDTAAEERVRSIWESLDDAGIESLGSVPRTDYRPHVSLAVFENANAGQVQRAVAPALQSCVGTPLTLASLGFFLGPAAVAFLGVTPTRRLLDIHQSVHTALKLCVHGSWPLYEPGSFVPHCTLSMTPGDAEEVARAVSANELPVIALAREVQLVEISTGRSLAQLA